VRTRGDSMFARLRDRTKMGKDLYLAPSWKLLTSAGVSLRDPPSPGSPCVLHSRKGECAARAQRPKTDSKSPYRTILRAALSLSAAPCSAAPTTNLRLDCVRFAERAFQLRNPLHSTSIRSRALDDNWRPGELCSAAVHRLARR
jgi:hypothetical protein